MKPIRFREQAKIDQAHGIQQMFQYQYKDQWCSQAFINSHSRQWIQVFNELVKEGFIEKKKGSEGHRYKWAAAYPQY